MSSPEVVVVEVPPGTTVEVQIPGLPGAPGAPGGAADLGAGTEAELIRVNAAGTTFSRAGQTAAALLDRANHTGTQTTATISDSTTAGRALLTAADVAAQRTALGLATVATTGAYADLSGLPSLGGAAVLSVGTTAGTVAAGDDARLSDARTPTAHASSHATGGSDPLTPAAIGAATAAQGALADTAVQPAAIATKLDDLSPGTADALVTASADGTLLSRAAHTIASLLVAARDRATHTGSQVAATISDFAAAALAAVTWSTLTGKPATFTPSAHQSAHAVGGGDPLAGLASVQMPIVSPGTAISTTTHTASDADAGRLISCTHASGCAVTFTDTGGNALTAGTSGGYLRGAGAGPISWAAGGTMVITTISTSSGHTETAAAPSRVFWHCVSASLVHVWGETA